MGSDNYKDSEVLLPTNMVRGNILRERSKKGYKQAYIAQKLGISERAYRNIEQGVTQKIQVDRLQKIASILEINDWNDLLEQSEKVSQIVSDNSNNNHQNVTFYPSHSDLIHENEKLQLKLTLKEQENQFLKEKISFLEDKIKYLEEKKN